MTAPSPAGLSPLLDQLDEARAKGTPGEWFSGRRRHIFTDAKPIAMCYDADNAADAALIVAAVNALPELIAKIRELDARISAGLALADEWKDDDHPEGWNYSEYLRAALTAPLAGQHTTDEWDEES